MRRKALTGHGLRKRAVLRNFNGTVYYFSSLFFFHTAYILESYVEKKKGRCNPLGNKDLKGLHKFVDLRSTVR